MIDARIEGVDFIQMNTDAQALFIVMQNEKLISERELQRVWAGSNPEIGKKNLRKNHSKKFEVLSKDRIWYS